MSIEQDENTARQARKRRLIRIVITVVLVFVMFNIGSLGAILLVLSGTSSELLALALAFLLLLTYVLLVRIWGPERLKRQGRKLAIVFALIMVVAGGLYGWGRYEESIPVLREGSVPLQMYKPFVKESRLARLEKTSAFRIKENPPRLDGALALYPVMASFVEAVYPEQEYKGKAGKEGSFLLMRNTPGAYEALIKGNADIIFVAGPSEAQKEAARAAGVELRLTPIGREAFVFFVNAKNPVKGLTLEQIKDIYSGKIVSWQEVGGEKEKIKAFQRPKNSGSQTMLEKLMAGRTLLVPPEEDRQMGMGGIVRMTADYKNHKTALGYSFRYFTLSMLNDGKLALEPTGGIEPDNLEQEHIRLLAINGVAPTKETIRSGQYPLVANFYAVTAGSKNPNVEGFIDWMLSDEGQRLIENTGYVGIN